MKGFTLLEVMIALAIMVGVLVTTVTAFNRHLSLLAEENEETERILLARAKLEELQLENDLPEKREGKFPERPDLEWKMTREPVPLAIPGIEKISVMVGPKGEGTTLVHYVAR